MSWLAHFISFSSAVASPATHDDLVAKLVAPGSLEKFYSTVYERHWAYFHHEEPVLPMEMRPTLEDVTSWADRSFSASSGADAEGERPYWLTSRWETNLMVLPHPKTGRDFDKGSEESVLQALHRAFLAGHSMVFNSLQDYSEAARRLVSSLRTAMGWPIDAYMYLTPPQSKSYGVHSDFMDAWMLQISGSKDWRVCEPRNFQNVGESVPEEGLNCTSFTMSGGDVMYVPFGTLHKAVTQDSYSVHLTVNIERQCYTWANILQAAAVHSLLLSGDAEIIAPWEYLQAGGFQMDSAYHGGAPIERWLLKQMRHVPLLSLTPLATSEEGWAQVLSRSAGFQDAPEGYWSALVAEWHMLIREMQKKLGKRSWPKVSWGEQQAKLKVSTISEASLRWALEAARVHSIEHLHGNVWFALSAIDSLAELRVWKNSADSSSNSARYPD
mmetsp:Transcript_21125/g.38406  ORF Transcript_21125/g.38406 Transcript_21125/m.38406 type:complete len:441 (+) Transcript_21125:38-1360(+)